MTLSPGKGTGIHGLIYMYRDDYEPGVRHMIKKYCEKGSQAYDIGANIGLWTLLMSELVGNDGAIYAFEPYSQNISRLKRNISLSACNNIEVIPTALGDTICTSILYALDDPGSVALASRSADAKEEKISVTTLDETWEKQGRPKIDLVKIDVEGAEPLVLAGGRKMFETIKPAVCCEINPDLLGYMKHQIGDVFELLLDYGYESYLWDSPTNSVKKAPCPVHGNRALDYIFLPR